MRSSRAARINYSVRSAAFAYSFLVLGIVLWERGAGAAAWLALAASFLAYPHLAFLRTRLSGDGYAAELGNLRFDPVLIGAWVAALGFPTWIAYAGLFSTTLNSAVMRGWQGAGWAAVLFAAGALAWIAPMGFQHYAATSDLVTALCFFGSLGYTASLGLVVHSQQQRLRAARAEVRASEERYRLIAENAGDLIAMVDRDGRWLYSSPSYAKLLGARDLEPGADAFRAVAEEDQFRARAAVLAAMQSGDSCRLRLQLRAAGGELRRLESLVHAVREPDGTVRGAVLVSRDVTEQRAREEQLEIAAHAFERMAEAVVVTSAEGRILSVNRAFSAITGYGAEEVLGRNESEFRSAMQPREFYAQLHAEVLETGRWSGATWSRRRDGTLYREWRSVAAVRDGEGRVTHLVTLFRELDGGKPHVLTA